MMDLLLAIKQLVILTPIQELPEIYDQQIRDEIRGQRLREKLKELNKRK